MKTWNKLNDSLDMKLLDDWLSFVLISHII